MQDSSVVLLVLQSVSQLRISMGLQDILFRGSRTPLEVQSLAGGFICIDWAGTVHGPNPASVFFRQPSLPTLNLNIGYLQNGQKGHVGI